MTEIITRKDCMQRLEAGETVTMEVYTYDEKRGKGGKIETYECRLETGAKAAIGDDTPHYEAEDADDADDAPTEKRTKSPNHSKWYTRNIRLYVNGHPSSQIRKIHPLLIRTFNGVKVVV